MRIRISALLLILVSVLLSGCGDSNFGAPPLVGQVSSVNGGLTSLNGGSLTHPTTGHSVTFSNNSLNSDTRATLSLLANHFPVTIHPEFLPVGQAMTVELGGAALTGEVRASIPFQATPQSTQQNALRMYWMLPSGFLYPLTTTFDSQTQQYTGVIPAGLVSQLSAENEFDGSSVTFGLLNESTYLSRPAHVDWPSYNLYVYENGKFVEYLHQGQPVSGRTLPDVGNRPFMVVHGLGSNIPNFNSTVQGVLGSQSYTTVLGFEYDTLSGITTTGPRLRQAYNLVEQNTGRDWHHLAHSMGCLISRQGIETGGAMPYQSNNVVLAAGPHIGSPIINALQANEGVFTQFITALVINNLMDFKNADGTPCKVSLNDQGFIDLANGSSALAALNANAASSHPKETYRTLGGNNRGLIFAAVNYIVGVNLDDGFVNLVSANPGNLIGSTESQAVPDNHLNITTDAGNGLRVILEYLAK